MNMFFKSKMAVPFVLEKNHIRLTAFSDNSRLGSAAAQLLLS